MSLERMGRCARLAWDHAVEKHRTAEVPRPAVTTAHILLGVLKETDCAGGLILGKIPLDLKLALGVTEFMLLHSRPRPDADRTVVELGGVPHTVAAAQTVELSVEEANLYSQTYPIGTEHLLLAVLRLPDSLGCRILNYLGIYESLARHTRDDMWTLLRSSE